MSRFAHFGCNFLYEPDELEASYMSSVHLIGPLPHHPEADHVGNSGHDMPLDESPSAQELSKAAGAVVDRVPSAAQFWRVDGTSAVP